MRQFMRPVICNAASGKYSHGQIYNPLDSGVRVVIDEINVRGSGQFTLVGFASATMFADANFPESRGLNIHQPPDSDPAGVKYSKAHSRIMQGPAIDGGMWGNYDGDTIITAPITLEPGTSVVIRSGNTNSQIKATFLWHEETI